MVAEAEPKNHQTKLCATAINLRHECAYRVHFNVDEIFKLEESFKSLGLT